MQSISFNFCVYSLLYRLTDTSVVESNTMYTSQFFLNKYKVFKEIENNYRRSYTIFLQKLLSHSS